MSWPNHPLQQKAAAILVFRVHCLAARPPLLRFAVRPPGGKRIMKWRLLQAWGLRLVGAVGMLALGAVFLPRAWMEAVHAGMGLMEIPKGPIFDSVMRQVSFTYGLHGVALW